MAKKGIIERLKDGPVLGDGGYLLELESRGYVQAGPFTPEVAIEHPDALLQLHNEFYRAGSEVLQTCTFYASEEKLRVAGLADKVEELNRSATRLARQAAHEDALVAGNLCLTWVYDPGSDAAKARTLDLFRQQVLLQAEEGVDFFIAETFHWAGEAALAAKAIKDEGYPAMITMNFKNPALSREGYSPAETAKRLEDAGADIVGTNCGRDPYFMLPLAEEMRRAVKAFVACQPAGFRCSEEVPYFMGRKEFPLELDPLQLTRGEMAAFALRARDAGINFIGACCGCAASHIRAMAEVLGRHPPASSKSAKLEIHPILGLKLQEQ
ncbi:MAG: homocysteine S-methyltransferase family protein [Bryobacteraceae bacterium]